MPHAAVSIALQSKKEKNYETVLGVIYDPFTDELWTATLGGKTTLNGRVVRCSNRARVGDSLVAIGFSKSKENLEKSLPHLNRLARRAKKIASWVRQHWNWLTFPVDGWMFTSSEQSIYGTSRRAR